MYIDLKPLIYSLEPTLSGERPILAILKSGKRVDNEAYIKSIQKKAEKLGVNILTMDLENIVDISKILCEVQVKSDAVLPIRPFSSTEELIIKAYLDYNKDVDNFAGKSKFENCTVEAVKEILNFLHIKPQKQVVIVGRHLGLEIALSLLERDFTPTICHSKTENLEQYTKDADVIISCTGAKNIITKDMVKVNATVIDVGLGDVEEDVMLKAYVTPVRNGVGAVTTRILFRHIFNTI
ncbi:methylenetetrahydrofolate dehydrogenase (NADP+)/methenyltetrahydrofolate cyclohydrolase [Clostridium pascui]|uniref:bifunctional 5,10-methylenetetrahydrofolate dehydrogenase/5,10-methenyltetrahydrofolate cyclohydrolase n=1 Tax=Clostridium pascui TaxID=46609 RepID=UPI001959316D|nr:bifunctional 5,10-methylenetetrahydrofolate dehydrogenase/5,10-methenyltetrahydrofolate cyclohydrolase [Clostridium pascui]MBM7869325.1 methylenetetrahydrofolate dehydrogenase (NADP+)/methenyltetrahydrofolate cyclohydrolase [Clostridium pascui]